VHLRKRLMKHTSIALLFPGQGSQIIGMGQALAGSYPHANSIYKQADQILGFSLSTIAWQGPEADLNDTVNTQPALLTHSIAAFYTFQELLPELIPAFIAGHSMGEISALVAAGSFKFQDALHLVRKRGELMKRSGIQAPGGMAAILGLDIPLLETICLQASSDEEIVQVANDNCPGQVVISGANNALDKAISLSKAAGAKRAIRLPVSIAAHSPLMATAQTDFNQEVDNTPISTPAIPIIGNVNAIPLSTTQAIQGDLRDQLTHRVRWTESIQYMIRQGINSFIEVGTGSVLTGLVKRIEPTAECFQLGTPDDFVKFCSSI
jgi:[acyl-carrier-protein] S-malonyltransferase